MQGIDFGPDNKVRLPERFNVAVPFIDRHLAEGRGAKVAICTVHGAAVTYAELADRVTRLAAGLATLAAPGERILLAFRQSLDFLVAFLGCQAAGLIPVPVSLPRGRERDNRLASIIADCTPRAALTHRDGARSLQGRDLDVTLFDIADLEAGANSLDDNLPYAFDSTENGQDDDGNQRQIGERCETRGGQDTVIDLQHVDGQHERQQIQDECQRGDDA